MDEFMEGTEKRQLIYMDEFMEGMKKGSSFTWMN